MLRTILAPPSNMSFHDVSTIKERHLATLLHPDFVPCELREDIEACDIDSKFATFRLDEHMSICFPFSIPLVEIKACGSSRFVGTYKLANTRPQISQVVSCEGSS